MTFPTEQNRAPLWLLFQRAQETARTVKNIADSAVSQMTGNVASMQVIAIARRLSEARVVFLTASSAPGMGDWVKEAFADQSVDIVADFNAMVGALDNARDWIVTNFPKDANGFLLRETINPDGTLTDRNFTPAQMAQLRTLLQTLSATIG